jgi:hypothetical protein
MRSLETIKKDIINTGYISDITIGTYFHMKYKELYKKILELTKPLESTFKVNLLFRGRVLFIIKYNCDLSKITFHNNYLTFDRKLDDFTDRTHNHTKLGWVKIKKTLNSVKVFKFNETQKLVKNMLDCEIFGRAKNRTLIKKNPKLYNSILFYSKELENFDKNNNKFPSKIIFIRDYNSEFNKLLCEDCQINYVTYNTKSCGFNKKCKKCYYKTDNFYPQIGFFKKKYGENWEQFYKKDRENIKNKKVNSLGWSIEKYGESEGKIRYNEYSKERVSNIINLSISSYSKISQELFWLIHKELSEDEISSCYFKELNREVFINGDSKIYIPDFMYKNKIIEYDGLYWHDKIKDNHRNQFYFENGYELLVITDNDFNRQKKPQDVVNKCVNFLRNETKCSL